MTSRKYEKSAREGGSLRPYQKLRHYTAFHKTEPYFYVLSPQRIAETETHRIQQTAFTSLSPCYSIPGECQAYLRGSHILRMGYSGCHCSAGGELPQDGVVLPSASPRSSWRVRFARYLLVFQSMGFMPWTCTSRLKMNSKSRYNLFRDLALALPEESRTTQVVVTSANVGHSQSMP